MAAMKRPSRPDNFRLLDPEAPRTQRLIEASLSALSPEPWAPDPNAPRPERSPIAKLADRIAERAEAGKTVHLTPNTGRTVAAALHLYAEGPPTLRSFSHRVEDWTDEPHVVLAYSTSATLAIGAWEAYAPQYPSRDIVARWGGWTMRSNRRNRA